MNLKLEGYDAIDVNGNRYRMIERTGETILTLKPRYETIWTLKPPDQLAMIPKNVADSAANILASKQSQEEKKE